MAHDETLSMLGKLIPADKTAGRDAVHIAVIPVVCGRVKLHVGEPVFVSEAGEAWPDGSTREQALQTTHGIVDPFLTGGTVVSPGNRFFVYLYPNSITGLRHVWTHPRLPNEPTAAAFEGQTVQTVTPAVVEEPPYLTRLLPVEITRLYNPKYGDGRVCECGHPYVRHFDSYDYNAAVGCKYCGCNTFVEKKPDTKAPHWFTDKPPTG